MQTKTTFTLLFVLLLTLGCNNQQNPNGYLIKGTVLQSANEKIYLETWSPPWIRQKIEVLDTATTDEEGKFTMNGMVNYKGIYQLRLGDQRAQIISRIYPPMRRGKETTTQILLDNSTIEFTTTKQNFSSYNIKGPKGAQTVQQIAQKVNSTYDKIAALQKNAMKASRQGGKRDSIQRALQQQFKQLVNNYRSFFQGMLDTVESPVVRLFAASQLDPQSDVKQLKKVLDNLKPALPDYPLVKKVSKKIDRLHRFAKGQKVPDIQLPNPEGDTIPLSSLKGKVVLIEFWASWCKPCRIENPHLVKLYKKYKDQGFTIYSVSLDKRKGRWVRAIKQDNLVWENHVSDLRGWNSSAARKYNVSSIPASFLIDQDGKILAKNLRGNKLDKKLKEIFNP